MARHRLGWLLVGLLAWGARPVCAQLRVSTDFEGGSAHVLALDSAAQRIRIAPAGDERRGMPNWWYLRLDDVDPGKPVILEVEARGVSVANDAGKVSPLNPSWTLPLRAAISKDGVTWAQTSTGDRNNELGTYRITTATRTVWLAWGPPFTVRNAAAAVESAAKAHEFARPFVLARSREGREVPALQISEGDKPAARRPAVWVIARQHAWECGSSWVATGLAEWLTGSDPRARWLRTQAEIWIVPLMDADHAATGDGGKYAQPQDHNRDWSEEPHWPEVAAVQARLRQHAQENRLSVFLDLHNPGPAATVQTFYVQYPPLVGEEADRLNQRFLARARAAFGEIRLRDGKPGSPEETLAWDRISTSWTIRHGNPQTVALTVETPWNTPRGTPDGYREVGWKLGQALEGYLHPQP